LLELILSAQEDIDTRFFKFASDPGITASGLLIWVKIFLTENIPAPGLGSDVPFQNLSVGYSLTGG
jgi:hypothetical protein